ncbi:hypothetical protein CI15_07610 [Paraburkholderia monticola]|uniref:Tyr recombinase domain-containing protein n=1 Tax=Paraburkholderia monticola TaxID=1399968 RepID=A0A149PY92_9BURK|nr:hypothetical protein [Paraburkholderia monticola]KXU90028.1 hypothetical protein CI15_07610 [Paraburkholderia monticola]
MATELDELQTKVSLKEINGRTYAVVYDAGLDAVVWEIVEYTMFLADELMQQRSAIEAAVLAVAAYRNFLVKQALTDNLKPSKRGALPRYEFYESSDDLLKRFRDAEYARVISRSSSNHESHAAKRTVNAKLVQIYHFLNWYQYEYGWNFLGDVSRAVTSSLKRANVRHRKHGASGAYDRFPALERRVGHGARRGRGYEASADDIDKLKDYFFSNFTSYVAVRNILMMDIGDSLGWRRGTINSLQCHQFTPEALEKMTARGLACVPDRQKNGYKDSFYVSPDLATRISAFIHDTRQKLIDHASLAESKIDDAVFVSARDGRALSDKAISKIFGRAFVAIGAPKRAGMHSFRRKFANDSIAAETRARLAMGLDTSPESVAAAVSMDLGQKNPESIVPYVSANQTRLVSRNRKP